MTSIWAVYASEEHPDCPLDDLEQDAEERSAIMEHDGEQPREVADTYSRQWLRECLARQVLAWVKAHGRQYAEEFLARYGKRHGAEAERALRDEINRQRDVA